MSGMFSNLLIITHLVRNIQAVTESLANSKNGKFQGGLQIRPIKRTEGISMGDYLDKDIAVQQVVLSRIINCVLIKS